MAALKLQLSEELLTLPAQLPAAESVTTAAAPLVGASVGAGGSIVQSLLALLLVLGLIVALGLFFKRFRMGGGLSDPLLQVRGGLSIGTREKLMLVQAGETWMLLAVMPGNVRTLHVFPLKPELAEQGMAADPGASLAQRFGHWLRPQQAA